MCHPVPRASQCERPQRGVGGHQNCIPPPTWHGDPPIPAATTSRAWGAQPPPRFPLWGRFRWQSQEAAVPMAGTEQMSPLPPGPCHGCPPPHHHTAPPRRGYGGSTPRAGPRGLGGPRGGEVPMRVTARRCQQRGGGGHNTAPPFTLVLQGPTAAQMSPPGLPLRLPAPLTAAVYSARPLPTTVTPPPQASGSPSTQTGSDPRCGDGGDPPAAIWGGFVPHSGCPGVTRGMGTAPAGWHPWVLVPSSRPGRCCM